jgi:hypothetical protein
MIERFQIVHRSVITAIVDNAHLVIDVSSLIQDDWQCELRVR